ncbi:DUF4407 domain-containing protein [Actinoplanes sp. NEAU-A12]|uniref:DUF4407 domain-containing protein n=1 Tax=Actinoplanes sandaracinus TaxID=3045177 RepID=A0ABT6WIZ7_9ACTN|nr:DUF4407 domain-containing protein [Actinoplanes sandaracinus]MDI6099709.1 DUF4407 domain-containing protein [Actinoplanes sandaracinus]
MAEETMGLKRILAGFAGGQRGVLDVTPGDELRYAAMGGVIVSTALVAAASAAMAVHMALGAGPVAAVLIGLAWGMIIFNLDRLLVVQMTRQDRTALTLLMAVPRVLLALVLGAVISTPVVLKIFEAEIRTQLTVMHARQIAEFNRDTAANPDYASIPALEQTIAEDERILAGGGGVNVESAPAVVAARGQYDDAQKKFLQAQANVVCEKEGACGSGRAGAGIAYHEKIRIQEEARATRDEARNRLAATRADARIALTDARNVATSAARTRLTDNRARLTDLRARLAADKTAHEAASRKDTGLLARLEALDEVAGDRPTLHTAHLALFLLFLALELLPVLMKLLQVLGPETDYEKVAKENSDHLLRLDRERRDSDLRTEQDRLRRASDAARAGNQIVIDTQAEVMGRVLQNWRQRAVEQADRDLNRWMRDSGPADAAHHTDDQLIPGQRPTS